MKERKRLQIGVLCAFAAHAVILPLVGMLSWSASGLMAEKPVETLIFQVDDHADTGIEGGALLSSGEALAKNEQAPTVEMAELMPKEQPPQSEPIISQAITSPQEHPKDRKPSAQQPMSTTPQAKQAAEGQHAAGAGKHAGKGTQSDGQGKSKQPGKEGAGAEPGETGAPHAPADAAVPKEPPKVVHRAKPSYPSHAWREGITGKIVVNCIVGTDGRVESTSIAISSGAAALDQAAEEAAAKWRYVAAKDRYGQNVRCRTTATFQFNIK